LFLPHLKLELIWYRLLERGEIWLYPFYRLCSNWQIPKRFIR